MNPGIDSDLHDDLSYICNIWSEVLGTAVQPDTLIGEAGGDSLALVVILARVATAYGVRGDLEALARDASPGGMLRAITEELRQDAEGCR